MVFFENYIFIIRVVKNPLDSFSQPSESEGKMSLAKISTVAVLTVLMGAAAFCASSSEKENNYSPWIDATGGPDTYGYKWADSDEDSVLYEWIDISAIGTEVTGLANSNYRGPFNLGFDFNYYWYSFDQVYIGSNGYLKIPPAYNIYLNFPTTIPLMNSPNDFIALYMMDLQFYADAECYYWTNEVDLFIVSFINVPCYVPYLPPTGSHTFQVILNGNDNTITFNYGSQEGNTQGDEILIGIENSNGQVGLLHSADTYLPSDFTVRFYRPDETTFEAHDLAIIDVSNEGSKGIFIERDDIYFPAAWIENLGTQSESGTTVSCQIIDVNNVVVFEETVITSILEPDDIQELTFGAGWFAADTGQYSVLVEHNLAGDMNTINDTLRAEIDVIELPGELSYEDRQNTVGITWSIPDGGFANYFDVPDDSSVEITAFRFFIQLNNALPYSFIARIYDNDGPGNLPGTILFEQLIETPDDNLWYVVTPETAVIDEDGKFYASYYPTGSNNVYLGRDAAVPHSRNGWECNSGEWTPYRYVDEKDLMIRVIIGDAPIPEPIIAVSADTLQFGTVVVGDTSILELTMYNIGAVNLNFTNIAFAGLPPIFYSVQEFIPGMSIAPGDSELIHPRFHPPLEGQWNAEMILNCNSIYGESVFCEGTAVLSLPIEITLDPVSLPIQIPAGGGTFNFNIGVANNGTTQITADIWSMATLPNGSQYGPIINFPNLTMNAGWSGDRDRTQAVPASAPTGAYTYDAYIGQYPNTVYDEDHFDFTKSADFDGSANFNEWTNWGEEFADISESSEISIPETFTTLSAYPNPFNPSTNITYNLPETGNVRIAVYDISGRLVRVLFDGVETAGTHKLSFNAQNLSSGIYICRMSAGNELKSIKILLMK